MDYTEKIQNLRERLGNHVKIEPEPSRPIMTFKSPIKNLSSFYVPLMNFASNYLSVIYISVPFLVLMLLLATKPSFITSDHISKDNIITKNIKYMKLFTYTIVTSCIINGMIWIYFKK